MREWIGLVVLTCPALLIGLDFTVLHLVLPHLARNRGRAASRCCGSSTSAGS
jgi:hypothetical protein